MRTFFELKAFINAATILFALAEVLMKKIGIIIFILALAVGVVISSVFSVGNYIKSPVSLSFGFGKIKGSGDVITETRELSGFKSIDVGGAFAVEIIAQRKFSVEVIADDNIVPLIETEVSGGELQIGRKKRFSTRSRVKIRIYAPDIDNLDISGASSVSLIDIKNELLKIDSSGASKIKIEGETNRLVIDTSGACRIDTSKLAAQKVLVDASGASRVMVNANENLTVDLSGASSVKYSGKPKKINKKTSGASSIREIS